MKHLLLLLPSLATSWLLSQSNDCSTATTLPVTATCSSPVSGTTAGASQSITGCVGTADDDVWYQFTATGTAHKIVVTPSASFDPVLQVFSGPCSTLISMVCRDYGYAGEPETVYLTGLTAGNVYKVRVYHYAAGFGSGTFSICLTPGPSAPANDLCTAATAINVNASCVPTAGTTEGATLSMSSCSGSNNDVWYSFVATNSQQNVTVTPTTVQQDLVFQVLGGTSCTNLTSEICVDNGAMDDPESSDVVGLIAGQTYYIRVKDYNSGMAGNFNICVSGPSTPAPTNDDPCSAIQLPPVTSNCNYLEFTTVGATTTTGGGIPAPVSCIGGSGAAIGGFGSGTRDVWFKITVPSSGNVYITSEPNMGSGSITDGVMALYSGTCGSLTQIQCSDDTPGYPGTANDNLPLISATGLAPGSTVYLRYWAFGTASSGGAFGLCVTTATNDNCSNALYICDLNGYSASTSAAYTPDRPCNMFGNNETSAGVDQPDGTNTGGIFGQGGSWGTGSPNIDVNINNNSWIRFTAAATTAVLNVTIYDCWVGNYPSGGIQMQVFSSTGGCCNFTPVSDFKENSSSFTITANNLVIGNDYYLMVDGFGGDICNYTISAQSGVQFPEITPVSPICAGSSVALTAPPGATSYLWSTGSTSQSINVTPPTTQDYSVEVSGLCGYKQTLITTVTVNPIPAAPTVPASLSVCTGATLNLSASFVSGGTYSWTGPNGFTSTLQNPSISGVAANNAGTYFVTVTVNGCTSSQASTTVTVNPIPAAPTASSNSAICAGQTLNLFSGNVSGATYSWTGPASFSSSVQNPSISGAVVGNSGTYSVAVTVNGCQSAATTTPVTINSLPTAPSLSSNSPVCSGNTLTLGAGNVTGATYSWTGPNSFSSTLQNPAISGVTTAASGTYSLAVTVNGCQSSASSTIAVTINPTPVAPAATSNSPVCAGSPINLSTTATGVTYAWSGPNSFTSSSQNPTISAASAANAGNYQLIVAASGCPSPASNVLVAVNAPATANAGSDAASCNGSAVTLNGNISGGAASMTWSSSGSGMFSNPAASNSTYTPSATDISNGTVTLTLTSDDPSGPCPAATDQMIVTISSSPSASFSYPATSYCQEVADPTPVFPVGSSGGTFSSTAGLNINPSDGSVDLSLSSPGTYTVTNSIAASGSCPGANATSDITIVGTPAPPPTTNPSAACDGDNVSLNAGNIAGATYSWTGPNGYSSSVQNPVINSISTTYNGTYFVTVTVAGCTSPPSGEVITVNPNPLVSITNGPSAAICPGDTITLNATGATSYMWSTTETTPSIDVTVMGSQSVTVVGTSNGCSASDTINLSNFTAPMINSGPTMTMSNCDSPTGALSGVVINGTPSFSYEWTVSGGGIVGLNSDLTNIPPGNYTLAVTDGNGCASVFGPFTVSNYPDPASPAIVSNTLAPCVGDIFTANVTQVSGQVYDWSGPATFSAQGASIVIDPATTSNSGQYCVTATENGCISSPACVTMNVGTLPNPQISLNGQDASLCAGESLTITASGGNSYNWTSPSGTTSTGPDVSIANASLSDAGYYVVSVTSASGCSATDSIQLLVNSLPTVGVSVSNSGSVNCLGSTIQLFGSGVGSYQWTGPNGFFSAAQSPFLTNLTSSEEGTYHLIVTNPAGCVAEDSVNILVQQGSAGNYTTQTGCPGASLPISAEPGLSWSWTGPGSFVGNTQTVIIPHLTISTQGLYVALVTDSTGCSHSDTINAVVQGSKDCIDIPQLVTPNGDGNNDAWEVSGLDGYPDATVEIFNRWGSLVYAVSPYTTPWAGEPNKGLEIDGEGGKLPQSTYFYLIRLNDTENTEYKGYLELQY